jgi:hypothetical protein
MAAAETARLIASLELRDKLSSGVKTAQTSLGKFESRWDKVSSKLKTGLVVGGIGAAAFIGKQVSVGLQSLADLESAVSSVDGAIAQVGPTWTTTGSQIAEAANRIEANVGAAFDDKDIVSATETLIRYGKVTEKNLEPAMEVMTDLAARTGSVDSAAQLLAKALADPAKAAGKLARSGVVLTKAQQDTIEAMVEANDMAGAQAYLLSELEKTTKGAAAASQGPYKRSQMVLADTMEDAQRAIAEGFLPVIERVRDILQKGLADKNTVQGIRDFGKSLASGLDSLIDIATGLPWQTIGDSLRLAGTGAKAVLDAFTSLPPWLQTAVLTGWGLNKLSGGLIGELGKGLIKGVLGMTAGVVNINAGAVRGGGLPAAGAAGGVGAATLLAGAAVTAAAVAAVAVVQQEISKRSSEQARAIEAQTTRWLAQSPSREDLVNGLNGVKQGITDIRSNPLLTLVQGDTLNSLQAMEGNITRQIAEIDRLREQANRTKDDTVAAQNRTRDAALETKRETSRGTSVVSSNVRNVAPPIVGAIRANRPIVTTNVNVNVSASQVTKSVTVQERVGNGNGSSGGGSGHNGPTPV